MSSPEAVMETIRFVCATRKPRQDFFRSTALGRSLALYNYPFVQVRLFDNNSTGLPVLYNTAIEESKEDPAILVFTHDDVHICDFFWPDHIWQAVNVFNLVGLAGNKRRIPRQPAWAFIDTKWTWDSDENLSGVIGHGKGFPMKKIDAFGAPCQEVKLLDGVIMFCRSQMLLDHALRFDERFDFHFYDMDFCREAEVRKLKMGTWAISAIHESAGNFGSAAWSSGYEKYLSKWGE